MQFKAQRKCGMAISREGKIITYDWRPVFTEDVTFEMGLTG